MYLLPIFLPFITSLFITVFANKIGSFGVVIFCLVSMVLALVTAVFFIVDSTLCSSVCWIKVTDWMQVSIFQTNWGFLFDPLVIIRLVVILTISILVHFYAVGYMGFDPHLPRFMVYLSLFTGFMILLVTADNYLQLFLGWEGVGVTSFLLINFWYTRIQAVKSAIKAIIFNRVGDFFLLLGILNIFFFYGTLDFQTIFNHYDQFIYRSTVYKELYFQFAYHYADSFLRFWDFYTHLETTINDRGYLVRHTFAYLPVLFADPIEWLLEDYTQILFDIKNLKKQSLIWLNLWSF